VSDKPQSGDVKTTGHLWDDDLADFTNQPPKWWMLGLTVSAIWCVAYALYYPTIPVSSGGGSFTKGFGNWTAISEMEADQSVVDAVRNRYEGKLKNMTPAAILADKEMTQYVTRSGKVLFGDNCAACHGQNGVGTKDQQGYLAPVLNDDDWLYGGKVDAIYASITDGRRAVMIAHKSTLSEGEVDTLARAILAGKPTSTTLYTEKGCVACHGPEGKGIQAMGSANLTDKVWRFDSSLDAIKSVIKYGVNSGDPMARDAVMPSFKAAGKLTETDMKKLAVYVYKFGGGQPDEAAAPVPAASPAALAAPAAGK
jgi:cytochrome c oxidase cbb3-type subunit 3